ncbi:MAG: ABC transporter substrate-binding protein [Betaproteobacteria bacterium]|nr:ABC transporter substrate-binding protein [Betaproteobacteria bacterium]
MRRRAFMAVVGGLALWPLVARAQHKPARIALLGGGTAEPSGIFVDAVKQGLRDHGLVEGRDYVLDVRWAEGAYERFPALVRELVKQNPSAILVNTIAAVRAAQSASKTIPIVMMHINDPVGAGLIASLARPGGNTTGNANLMEDVTPKMLEMLRVVVPTAAVIAVLFNPANPSNRPLLEEVRRRAGASGQTVLPLQFKTPGELDATFEVLVQRKADALLVIPDVTFLDLRERIAALALRHRLPAFSTFPELTDAGGLLGYGPSRLALSRRSAYYVKKILDGAKAADLPVEQPTRIELSVNLKTAKALGVRIPESILLRADRVIE